VLDFVVDGDLADSPDTVVELEVFDQHWIADEEVSPQRMQRTTAQRAALRTALLLSHLHRIVGRHRHSV
jgi:hypothetical protein